ncbi:glycosyltransferase family 2 protein [Candidatus Saccharibacteria bacterium]|nr:glycosyltransferase family 2 protein [Candidatus Saccharibacteria bacterium]
MSTPLISVIVPVYNVKEFLPECLDSLKLQTYKNLEILFVDDGSTDGSLRLLEAYKLIDKRARILKKKNGGLSSARNFGLEKAKGKYVFFLDSDDCLEKDALEYYYKLIEKSGALISVTPHIEKKEDGKIKNFNSDGLKTGKFSVEEGLRKMLNERGFNLQSTCKLFSRELFEKKGKLEKIRFPENKLHEDVGTTYKLFLRAALLDKSAKIAFGSQPKYIYNIRRTSITNRNFNAKKLELITQTDAMCDEIEKFFPNLLNTTSLRRVHARFSILRQIIQKSIKTDREQKLENSLENFIKEHKAWVLKNPEAGRRDKLALLSLLLGKSFFKFSWGVYESFFK